MAPPLHRKQCKRCGKVFFTYDYEKEFCTNVCEGKFKYCEHFKVKDSVKKCMYVCSFCFEPSKFPKFCSNTCQKQAEKRERVRTNYKKFLTEKKKRPRKKADFEASNLRAEIARVFDDSCQRYRINRDKI